MLVARYEKLVYRTVCPVLGNRADAEDLTQEIFLRLWRGLPGFRHDAKFFTYLMRIVRNTCVSFQRKQKQERVLFFFRGPSEDEEKEPTDDRPEADPEETLLGKERTDAVQTALGRLSQDRRVILQLRECDGLSYAEIGEKLGLREGTVRSRLCRARKDLKKILENGNFFEETASNHTEGQIPKKRGTGDGT